jgi:xanthine dehydrogenase accessory factor
MNNIYLHLSDLQQTDSDVVLATVFETTGSTPQKPGSSALFDPEGLVMGTVGGGVLEREVQQIAQKAIRSKESVFFQFRFDGDISHGDDAVCGGEAGILVDASPEDHFVVFESMKHSLMAGSAGVMITIVTNPTNPVISIKRYWLAKDEDPDIPYIDTPAIAAEVQLLHKEGKHGDCRELKTIPSDMNQGVMVFLEVIFPPARLVIAGAGHIGKALSHIGKLLDFEVTVVDDRPEFANTANLPDADHVIVMDIGKAMDELEKTPDTFVAIVTRGHKDDAKALKACIGTDIAYLGMIGSKKKIAMMQKDFMAHGWASQKEWDSIHAPIGLDIQSVSVQEIAISIAAQLVLVKNSKKPLHG